MQDELDDLIAENEREMRERDEQWRRDVVEDEQCEF